VILYTDENAFMMTRTTKSPTISDVAERAGVSIATVSRVINGDTPVVEETAERVRIATAELRFVPRTAARTLASRKTNTIGLILSEIGGSFFLLLLKSSLELSELQRLHYVNFPVVLMRQSSPAELNIPVITIENKDGAEMLFNHLIEKHGRRQIIYMQGPEEHEDSQWRERGYREALEKHGIPFDPELVVVGGFDEEQAYASVQQILMDGIEFDAVFAGDDDAAIGVYRALKMARRAIPNDVQFARYISPALTTIRAPIEEVGRGAVRQLARLLNDQPAQALTLMPIEFIIRESCGCEFDHSKGGEQKNNP
jgi:DNA-binding LacI/PurR family transcriptional regulator